MQGSGRKQGRAGGRRHIKAKTRRLACFGMLFSHNFRTIKHADVSVWPGQGAELDLPPPV